LGEISVKKDIEWSGDIGDVGSLSDVESHANVLRLQSVMTSATASCGEIIHIGSAKDVNGVATETPLFVCSCRYVLTGVRERTRHIAGKKNPNARRLAKKSDFQS